MFRVGFSASLHRVSNTIPRTWGVSLSTLQRPSNSIRAFSTSPNSRSRFSYQQQQQKQRQQRQQQHHERTSWSSSSSRSSSSSSSRIILFSSTAALVAATGITLYNNEHAHAAPLTHNHPHNPIVLTAPKELPTEVIGADLVIASRWRRVVARLLDSMIQGFICQAGAFFVPEYYNAVALVVSIAYELLLNVYNDGQTFGKMMTRIRTVKDSGDTVDLQAAFLNWFGFAFFTLLAGADALWSVFNLSGDYKCLHNVISGTIVVDTSSLAAEEKQAALARWKHHLVDVELEDEEED